MESTAERGFLVLADISGFTAFVTTTELEHGPPIIAELLEAVIERLAPPLAIQEVEGDAVFAFAVDDTVVPAAGLLDVVDDAFAAFSARRSRLAADDSCACRACRGVGTLDLKVIAHHGAFLRQTVAGRPQLGGADVILAHRLLKNGLARSNYLLLTEAALEYMDVEATGLVAQSDRYEHLGEVRCFVAEPGSIARLAPAVS